jgi:predicted AlkP superfamily pyrophosphatase or phosphodiesterase
MLPYQVDPAVAAGDRRATRAPRATGGALLLLLCSSIAAAAEPGLAPKSLVVCFDGWRADAVGPDATPTIERLATGRWQPGYRAFFARRARTIEDAPSLSGPNHAAILTGVTARRHGITSNSERALAAMDVPDYLQWLERETPARVTVKLAAWPPAERLRSGADVVAIGDDATIVTRAEAALAGDVDALFLFLDGPDAAGHADGFGGAAYARAVAEADRALGRLLDVVASRPAFAREDWQIVVTTDHGGVGRDHGGPSEPETTIPFLVASRQVTHAAGGVVRNVDVAPTVLAHFGVDPTAEPYRMDGVARVPVTAR